ncbi:MAG: hypothetical protein WC498_02620 [Candidatus Saccharimonadales bacterium]
MAVVQARERTIAAERARERTREDILEAELSLRSLVDVFSTETCPQITEKLSSFDIEHLQRPRFDRHRTKTVSFLDGFVIIETTREGTSDVAHQLTVANSGTVMDVSYCRTTTDVQYRARSSDDIHIKGIEAIAAETTAFHSLSQLLIGATIESEQGWPGACGPGELVLVRRPVADATLSHPLSY